MSIHPAPDICKHNLNKPHKKYDCDLCVFHSKNRSLIRQESEGTMLIFLAAN